jgi:hypothetical protein
MSIHELKLMAMSMGLSQDTTKLKLMNQIIIVDFVVGGPKALRIKKIVENDVVPAG